MKPNPVVYFEIYVQNLARARRFYEAVFDTRLEPMSAPGGDEGMQMLAFPMAMNEAGAAGALVRMEGVPSGGSTTVYFGCEDCGVEAARAEAVGGKLFQPKTSIGEHGYFALIHDPDGNQIGLHSQR